MVETNLPVLLLKEYIVLPYNELRLEINSDKEKDILKNSEVNHDSYLLLINLKDSLEENPGLDQLPSVAILGKVKSKIVLSSGVVRIVLMGIERVKVLNYLYNDSNLVEAFVTNYDDFVVNENESEALRRILLRSLEEYIESCSIMSNNVIGRISGINSLSKLSDIILGELPFNYSDKFKYISMTNPVHRVRSIVEALNVEIETLKIENSIESTLKDKLDIEQRDYILREKIKLIKEELGEANLKDNEVLLLLDRLKKLDAYPKIKRRIEREIRCYEAIPSSSPEISIVRGYIETLLSLPWNCSSKDCYDINNIEKSLNDSHYGLLDVKNIILEYAALRIHNPKVNSPILCLVGPPGVGKTSLAKEIAFSLNRKFIKISVGGVSDECEIKGHRRTYVGAFPGKIIQGIIKAKVNNPVFLIDEIDKMVSYNKGDPASALLDVLDKEQNGTYVDNYIEEEVDLSKILFILTANNVSDISPALRDRLEIVTLSSYSIFDKVNIAKSFLIPRLLKKYNLTNIYFPDKSIRDIIIHYTNEAGVRELERIIGRILRKVIVMNKSNIILNDVKEYLGNYKYNIDSCDKTNMIGLVNGLGYYSYGGCIVRISSTYYKGSGRVICSGNLGDIARESVDIAFSYIKSNCERFNIDFNTFVSNDFHIHFERNKMAKDGASGGVSIVCSLISLLTGKMISSDIAFSGEITLRGKVLGVGSIKDKLIAASFNCINRVFVPLENASDVMGISSDIKDEMDIVLVDSFEEIYHKLFE